MSFNGFHLFNDEIKKRKKKDVGKAFSEKDDFLLDEDLIVHREGNDVEVFDVLHR